MPATAQIVPVIVVRAMPKETPRGLERTGGDGGAPVPSARRKRVISLGEEITLMRDDDNDRRLPVFDESKVPNDYRNGKVRHQALPKQPSRAIAFKAAELRAAMRHGNPIDWGDLYERFVDLWQEGRLALWRAKHHKAGLKKWDPDTQQDVQTFTVDEKQVLATIDTLRGVLDSMMRLREKIGPETTGIPRWAVERIECALRNYPEALKALLTELAAEGVQ